MKRFGMGIVGGLTAVFGGIASAFGVLAVLAPDRMPAPAVSRLVPLDEKLRFLRENPAIDPTVLVVGSSVAWRQIYGQPFERGAGGPERFLNGATGYLQVHQTHELARFYLDHYANVRTVLLVTGLPDFRDCTSEPRDMLDVEAAADYAFRGWPAIYFYLSHFSPQRYLRGILDLPAERTPFVGGLYIDAYGSGPLTVPDEMKRGLRYGAIAADPACLNALRGFVADMVRRHLRMTVVIPPVHPLYRRTFPGADRAMAQLAAFAREAAANNKNVKVLALYDDPDFVARDFFDAFHLQWPAAQRLSVRIARTMASVHGPDSSRRGGPRTSDVPESDAEPDHAS